MTLDQALASAFFQWLHLEPVGERANMRVFRPQAPKLHAQAEVGIALALERIVAMQLILNRSFISDPQDSASARDMARSFIQFACSKAGAAAPRTVLDEIQFRDLAQPILMRGRPDLPPAPSTVFQAFIGRIANADLQVGTVALTLRSSSPPRGELLIAAEPRTVNTRSGS